MACSISAASSGSKLPRSLSNSTDSPRSTAAQCFTRLSTPAWTASRSVITPPVYCWTLHVTRNAAPSTYATGHAPRAAAATVETEPSRSCNPTSCRRVWRRQRPSVMPILQGRTGWAGRTPTLHAWTVTAIACSAGAAYAKARPQCKPSHPPRFLFVVPGPLSPLPESAVERAPLPARALCGGKPSRAPCSSILSRPILSPDNGTHLQSFKSSPVRLGR